LKPNEVVSSWRGRRRLRICSFREQRKRSAAGFF